MTQILTIVGVVAASAGFLALALFLRPGKVLTNMPRMRLRVASLFTVVWSIAAWFNGSVIAFDDGLNLLLSFALVGVWVWQLDTFAGLRALPPLLRTLLQWSGAAVFTLALGWLFFATRVAWIQPPSLASLALLGIALCTLGLVAVEQIYRNAPADSQRGIRWLGLGIGGILVIEMVSLTEGMLLGDLAVTSDFTRGIGQAFCALAMIRGARLMPRWQLGISVSRHVVFYASSFLLIGGYLVLMAAAGWLILRFGDGWQAGVELLFLALAGAGLGLSLFSGRLFGRLKVLISTHFYPHHYDYRQEWMRFTRTMSEGSAHAELPQHAIRALAQIVGSPGGCLWQSDAETGQFRAKANWPENNELLIDRLPLQADDVLPSYLQRTSWLVDLAEMTQRPELYGDLRIDAVALGASPSALIVPLLHGELLYGWILLDRGSSQKSLDYEDRDLLKTAGRQVAAHLAQADAAARLAEANQFETFHRMTAFVMHDLKNVAAQLRLISQNAERHRRKPEFVDDAFRSVAAAAARMSKLINQLATDREASALQTVDLASCAEKATQQCSGTAPVPRLSIGVRTRVMADQDHLVAVIEHAIRNAQDATPPDGEVCVEVDERAHRPTLTVKDNGAGMDAQFVRERLFRPFDSTKEGRGMGIGAFQIREYLRSLGGEVEVQSTPGEGTSLTMLFASQAQNLKRFAG